MKRSEAYGIRKALDSLTVKIAGKSAEINEHSAAIRPWKPGTADKPVTFTADVDLRMHGGVPYTCSQTHTHSGEPGWEPSPESALWKETHGTTPETARPFVTRGDNPYMAGEYCTEDGIVHLCKQDNCTWPPSVYPQAWELAQHLQNGVERM